MAERDLALSEVLAVSRGLLATVVERESWERPAILAPHQKVWGDWMACFSVKPIMPLYGKRYRRLAEVFDVPSFLRDAILTDILNGNVPSQWLYDTVKSWTTLIVSAPDGVLDFWVATLKSGQEPVVSCLRLAISQRAMGYDEPELGPTIQEVLGRIMPADPAYSRMIRKWTFIDAPSSHL